MNMSPLAGFLHILNILSEGLEGILMYYQMLEVYVQVKKREKHENLLKPLTYALKK